MTVAVAQIGKRGCKIEKASRRPEWVGCFSPLRWSDPVGLDLSFQQHQCVLAGRWMGILRKTTKRRAANDYDDGIEQRSRGRLATKWHHLDGERTEV